MNLSHHPTHTPHQSACYSRAVLMGYNRRTAEFFARLALHARREGESPTALAMRVVVPMQGSAMVAL